MELLFRDVFGVHGRGDRPAPGFWRRISAALAAHLVRPRRFSPEVAFWTAMILLLVLFVAVLITGETGVARGGR